MYIGQSDINNDSFQSNTLLKACLGNNSLGVLTFGETNNNIESVYFKLGKLPNCF